MVSFEIFVKSMPPSLSELKVLPSFCFAFKIPDDVTVTNKYHILQDFHNIKAVQQETLKNSRLLTNTVFPRIVSTETIIF